MSHVRVPRNVQNGIPQIPQFRDFLNLDVPVLEGPTFSPKKRPHQFPQFFCEAKHLVIRPFRHLVQVIVHDDIHQNLQTEACHRYGHQVGSFLEIPVTLK